jgi:diacylglycerol kinase (ATP)
MTTAIIVNPISGQGRALRLLDDLKKDFPLEMARAKLCLTSGPGHASALVPELILEGFRRLVVIGGDGTWGEVINGALTPGNQLISPDLEISLLPGGSGSDLLRTPPLSSGREMRRAALLGNQTVLLDVLKIYLRKPDGEEQLRFALNSASAGISGRIASSVSPPLPFFSLESQYLLAFFRFFWRFQPISLSLSNQDQLLYEGPILNVFFCNGGFSGGGLRWIPDAQLDDGVANLLVVEPIRKSQLPGYIPMLIQGKIHQIPEAHSFQVRQVHALFSPSAYMEMDGETFHALELRMEVVPRILRLLVG